MTNCPNCNFEWTNSKCEHCGYHLCQKIIYTGMLLDGDVHVPACQLSPCIQREGDTTHFCPHLISFQQMGLKVFLVTCEPLTQGDREQ